MCNTTKNGSFVTFSENCTWAEWTESECSLKCGSGTKNKTRSKKTEERYGGICDGSPTEIETCIGDCDGNKKQSSI